MTSSERFSKRHGYRPRDVEIRVRDDAPSSMRSAMVQIAIEVGLQPSQLREILCRVLRVAPNPNNWSDPNVLEEVEGLIQRCEWFRVYDIAEAVYDHSLGRADEFEPELNEYFREAGIGWQLVEGRIQVRGPESFEVAVGSAKIVLQETGRQTAGSEIHEALADLSRRPVPDLTGAVHHAMASLECVARGLAGDPKATLGAILKRHPNLIPKPLDVAVDKAWGYASERARHIREGEAPTYQDAELVVGLAATVATYLVRKHHQ